MKNKSFGVIGAGSWGTALVKMFSENLDKINWYIRNIEIIEGINKSKRNLKYLRHVQLNNKKLNISNDLKKIIEASEILIIAIPSPYIDSTFQNHKELLKNKIIISASKGVIPKSQLVISQHFHINYAIKKTNLGIISGPCHAEEVALEKLSYLTIGVKRKLLGNYISDKLKSKYIKTSVSTDLIGIEYSATLKNIYSILVGISHGLGYGDNFLSVLISHCAKELKLFMRTIHRTKRDINHSAYIGDLLVTTYSSFSRNRTFGNMIGKGYSVKSAMSEMSMVVEGYYATKNAYEIIKSKKDNFLFIESVYKILYDTNSPKKILKEISEKLY
ncbi:MAG: glycerol-3-phosphate dehydrogenase [Cryomorphaceae bacterium MED-G14]|nr:MAG: glycerol-3-phosphate dehydrogenase [Cryomorphaceae bacterium MED-G14]|tara:strand:+ start:432 stop:1424 length:993 start_codon:yes stop_codon:yes gene_type:complete